MAVVGDSGAIYALYDRRDAHHAAVARAVRELLDVIVVPSLVLAEIDYLLRLRVGVNGSLRLLDDIAAGAFQIEPVGLPDLARCRELIARFADLGLCDASVVAIAERIGTSEILTVGERDFRIIRTSAGQPFRLLPADLE